MGRGIEVAQIAQAIKYDFRYFCRWIVIRSFLLYFNLCVMQYTSDILLDNQLTMIGINTATSFH